LMVFENSVLRRLFGPKRDEVTGEWGKLLNEELNDLYSLPNIVRVVKSRRMRWTWHVARMGDDRGVKMVLVGKPEGNRPLRRPRRRWKYNIKMDVQEVGGGRGDWMELAEDSVTGYFSKSVTRAPPREYYTWWSQELLSVYRLGGNKDNCGRAFSGLFSHSLYLL